MSIRLNKKIQITGGEAPFNYAWTSGNACLSFSQATGTINGSVINTDIIFANDACNATTATLTITSNCGNTQQFTINIANPCNSFIVNPITFKNEGKNKVFSVSASASGCDKVDVVWDYDTNFWTEVSRSTGSYDASLVLTPKSWSNSSTPVQATVSNCKGCSKSVSYSYASTILPVSGIQIFMYQDSVTKAYFSPLYNFFFKIPTGMDTATTTVEITLPSGMLKQQTPITPDPLQWVFTTADPTSVQLGSYVLKDSYGNITNSAPITFNVISTTTLYDVTLIPQQACVPLSLAAGTVFNFELDATKYVTSTGVTIDWSTFTLQHPLSVSPSIKVGELNGKRTLQYTIPASLNTDTFSWTVKDSKGIWALPVVYSFYRCSVAPVANNDTLSMTAGTTKNLVVLNNDTSGVKPDPKTVVVSDVAAALTVAVLADGSVNVTAASNVTGNHTFKYKFKDLSGNESNTATVTVTIVNAGSNVSITLCN